MSETLPSSTADATPTVVAPTGPSPAGRATAVFVADPAPLLRCSYCASEITDDDADCPACTTPLDWGASRKALQAWQESGAA